MHALDPIQPQPSHQYQGQLGQHSQYGLHGPYGQY